MQPVPHARASLPLVLAAAALLGCEPVGPIPGGRLSGTLVTEPVADWSFTDDHSTIELETNPADPHSVNVWCIAQGERLYVPSRHPEKKTWVRLVQADPRVRVGVAGRLYPARAVRVTDPAEIDAVVPALVAKYDLDPPSPDEENQVWLFRLESAPDG